MVEKRLLAIRIACAEELAPVPVIDREREHAVNPLEHVRAPVPIAGEQHLGVGGRAEGVSRADELFAKFEIVVDLAVVRDDDLAVSGNERLRAVLGIDDREPRMSERELRVDHAAGVIGAAVPQ